MSLIRLEFCFQLGFCVFGERSHFALKFQQEKNERERVMSAMASGPANHVNIEILIYGH